jgi:hypothetical protein
LSGFFAIRQFFLFLESIKKIFRWEVIPMVCQTVKAGKECAFMTKSGCAFNGGTCHPTVELCEGCARIVTSDAGHYCMMYPNPAGKWAMGGCASATHKKSAKTEPVQKVNPLKASKRSQKA